MIMAWLALVRDAGEPNWGPARCMTVIKESLFRGKARINWRKNPIVEWGTRGHLGPTVTKPSRAAGNHGASVLCQKMALTVEALNILLSGIWSF